MCLISEAIRQSVSRRDFLKAAGALATVPLLGGTGGSASAAPQRRAGRGRNANRHTRVVLLGTAGGPSWWPDSNRVSAASVLVVGDALYLIDLGHGSMHRMAEAFCTGVFVPTSGGRVQQGYADFLRNVRALFFTHLHMDHTADYPSLLLCGQGAGLNLDRPLEVYGPGDRGMLDPVFGNRPEPRIENPDNPTPGTVDMTDHLFRAYAQTINNFTRDNGWADFRTIVNLHDIVIPENDAFVDANTTPAPPMEPFSVYVDESVSVHAILVNHQPVFPSFAFRFETDAGSVVFSGDTGLSPNLVRLARGADILVHEVIDPVFIDLLFPDPGPGQQALINHLKQAHTTIDVVGGVAESAGVGTLVLNHIVPGNTPMGHLLRAGRNFSGRLVVGADLMQIPVG